MTFRTLPLVALTLATALAGCLDHGGDATANASAKGEGPESVSAAGSDANARVPPGNVRITDQGTSAGPLDREWEWFVHPQAQLFTLRLSVDSGHEGVFAGELDFEVRREATIILDGTANDGSNAGVSTEVSGAQVLVDPASRVKAFAYDLVPPSTEAWYTFELDAWVEEQEAGTLPASPYRYDVEILVEY